MKDQKFRFPDNEDGQAYAAKMRVKHAKFSVILNLCLIAGALLFIRCMLALNGYFNTLDMSNDAAISAIKPMQAPKVVLQQFSPQCHFFHTYFPVTRIHRMAAW